MRLVGFIKKRFVTMHGHVNVKCVTTFKVMTAVTVKITDTTRLKRNF